MLVDDESMGEGACGSESSLSGWGDTGSVVGMSDGTGDGLPFVWGVKVGVSTEEGMMADPAGES